MHTGKALRSYLLGGFAPGYSLYYVDFRSRQQVMFLNGSPLSKQQLHYALVNIAGFAGCRLQCIADRLERTVLEDNTESMRRVYDTTQESLRQLVADKHPRRHGEPLADDKQLLFINEIKQRLVQHNHGILVFLQQLDESRLVSSPSDNMLLMLSDKPLQSISCQVLVVCQNVVNHLLSFSATKLGILKYISK